MNLITANIVNNNFPNINTLSAKDIVGTDLLTYSFPCQGLSIANMGRGKGIKKNVDSTSNLIWQIKRLLDEVKKIKNKLPKYLLLENVKALMSSAHIRDYKAWKKYLRYMGYETYTTILNGLNHRSLQKRERLFAISVLGGSKTLKNDKVFQGLISSRYKKWNLEERKKEYIRILNSSEPDEIKVAIPNNTPSRKKMAIENIDLEEKAEFKKYIFNTLTTKQDRHPNIGMIKIKKTRGKLHKRFITYSEAYQIMGFELEDIKKVKEKYKEGIITKESLYRQAGNSIVVTVLEDIFKLIWDLEKRWNE